MTTYDVDDDREADFVQIDDTVLAVPPRPAGTDLVGVVFTGVFAIVCAVITGVCSVFVSHNVKKDTGQRVEQLERQLAELAPPSPAGNGNGNALTMR